MLHHVTAISPLSGTGIRVNFGNEVDNEFGPVLGSTRKLPLDLIWFFICFLSIWAIW